MSSSKAAATSTFTSSRAHGRFSNEHGSSALESISTNVHDSGDDNRKKRQHAPVSSDETTTKKVKETPAFTASDGEDDDDEKGNNNGYPYQTPKTSSRSNKGDTEEQQGRSPSKVSPLEMPNH